VDDQDRDLCVATLLGAAAGFAGYALWKSWPKTSFVDVPHAWDSLTNSVQSLELTTPSAFSERLKRLETTHPSPEVKAEILPESSDEDEIDVERFRRMG